MVSGLSVLSGVLGMALSASSVNAQVHARLADTRIAYGANGQEHLFTRDTSVPTFREAWRDPSGMVWDDVVRNEDKSIRHLEWSEAAGYCEGIGAELPTKEDVVRLATYMGGFRGGIWGAWSGAGYTPQVLPGLNYAEGTTEVHDFWFRPRTAQSLPCAFEGAIGVFSCFPGPHEVRCVK